MEWTFDEFEHQIPFCSRVLTHMLATSSLSDEQEEALEMTLTNFPQVSSQDKSGHRACTHHQLRYMRALFDAQHGLLSWLGLLICAVQSFIIPSLRNLSGYCQLVDLAIASNVPF